MKYYDLCRVCSIQWDFIGKLETAESDSDFIMERIGLLGNITLGLHNKSNDHGKMITYFKGFPKSDLIKIYEIFQEDFEIFGYTINDWLWVHLDER